MNKDMTVSLWASYGNMISENLKKKTIAGNFSNLEKMPTGLTGIPSLTYFIIIKVSPILITPE
jgi:hypothetical protein